VRARRTAAEHATSFAGLWSGLDKNYSLGLPPTAQPFFAVLDEHGRDVFRICRALWEHHGKASFFLASDHLDDRLDCRGGVNGWRLLQKFCAWRLIRVAKKGSRRVTGGGGRATTYDWLIG
jgi:hypothetical protein